VLRENMRGEKSHVSQKKKSRLSLVGTCSGGEKRRARRKTPEKGRLLSLEGAGRARVSSKTKSQEKGEILTGGLARERDPKRGALTFPKRSSRGVEKRETTTIYEE